MSVRHCVGQRLRRRGFLHVVSAGLSVLAGAACTDESAVGVGPDQPPPRMWDYLAVLVLYFENPEITDAAYIGEYRARRQDWDVVAAYASTAETRELIDSVRSDTLAVDDLGPSIPDSENADAAAVAALEQRVFEDFENARVVDVGGWTLAHTEVDLCVLAWLQ